MLEIKEPLKKLSHTDNLVWVTSNLRPKTDITEVDLLDLSRDDFFRKDILEQIPTIQLNNVHNFIHYELEKLLYDYEVLSDVDRLLYTRLFIEFHVYNIVKGLDWYNLRKPIPLDMVLNIYLYIEKWSRKLFYEYGVSENIPFWTTEEFNESLGKFKHVMKKLLDPPPKNIKRPTFHGGKWILPITKPIPPSNDSDLSEIFR